MAKIRKGLVAVVTSAALISGAGAVPAAAITGSSDPNEKLVTGSINVENPLVRILVLPVKLTEAFMRGLWVGSMRSTTGDWDTVW